MGSIMDLYNAIIWIGALLSNQVMIIASGAAVLVWVYIAIRTKIYPVLLGGLIALPLLVFFLWSHYGVWTTQEVSVAFRRIAILSALLTLIITGVIMCNHACPTCEPMRDRIRRAGVNAWIWVRSLVSRIGKLKWKT